MAVPRGPEVRPASTTEQLRATAHPLRLRMLSLLTGVSLSASEVARELGVSQANASYHLRVLAKAGLVVEAGEERIRGGVAKRYRHPWEENARHSSHDTAYREQYLRTMGAELVRRHRLREPGTPSMTADAELWVTPDIRDQVLELVTRAATLLHVEARPPRTEGTAPMNLTVAAFQMHESPEPDQP